jgi:hypothetical protein
MGFENRKDVRVKAGFHIFYWLGLETVGAAVGAVADNLSIGGTAIWCEAPLPRGQDMMLEMTLPGQARHLQVRGKVLRTDPPQDGRHLVRLQFTAMDGDTHIALRRHILQVSDPAMAAATGWGKAYFPDQKHYETEYRELPPGLAQKWLDEREYLSAKGLIYLKGFQAFLESYLGAAQPGAFKLMGTRPLKEKAQIWMQLRLPEGSLHILSDVLWCNQEGGEKAMVGLQPLAYQKAEALRIEKGEHV